MIGEKAGKPAAQRNLLRVLRSLLKVAVKAKLRRDNPALGIELERLETVGYHSWTEEELRHYEARHPVGTKARLALALLLYTATRRTDVVALGPPHMRNARLTFTYSKNKTEMNIPVAPPLADIIAATPMIGVKTFLVTEYGKQFTAAGFRDRCDEAGLPHCTAHGMRKAFLRRMAEAGCSEDYMPRSVATAICGRSGSTCRPPIGRGWRLRVWRRRWRISLRQERERREHKSDLRCTQDCQLEVLESANLLRKGRQLGTSVPGWQEWRDSNPPTPGFEVRQ